VATALVHTLYVDLPSGIGLGSGAVDIWGFLVAFRRWIGADGAAVDIWVFAAVSVRYLFDGPASIPRRPSWCVRPLCACAAHAACVSVWSTWFSYVLSGFPAWSAWFPWCSFLGFPRGVRCASRSHAPRVASLRGMGLLSFRCIRFRDARDPRDFRGELAKRGFFFHNVGTVGNGGLAVVLRETTLGGNGGFAVCRRETTFNGRTPTTMARRGTRLRTVAAGWR
jgi:hypothetical protein